MKQNATTKNKKKRIQKSKSTEIVIPETMKVGGHTFEICMDERTDLFLADENALGVCDPRHKAIALSTRLDYESLCEVYIHEIIEAVNALYTLDIPHPAIQCLALGIHQALTSGVGEMKPK